MRKHFLRQQLILPGVTGIERPNSKWYYQMDRNKLTEIQYEYDIYLLTITKCYAIY